MLLVTTTEEAHARARQVHVNGRDYTLAEYVGAAPQKGMYVEGNEVNDNGLPQGFLVHQPPNAITPAHFHEPNQFQVFVEGNGRIGACPAVPLTIQYANGHTPYGPIVAYEEGVKYFTLRQRWDPGAKYLPASRDKLVKGNQRTRVKGGVAVCDEAARRARRQTSVEVVFPAEADGLAGWMVRLGPGGTHELEDPSVGGGQYLVVAEGDLVGPDLRMLPRLSTIFISPEEARQTVRAGADGADLLVLQFPRMKAD